MNNIKTDKYTLMLGECLEHMQEIETGSVDMVLTDIPYDEVSQKSSGLRLLDRGKADRCDIDLRLLVGEFHRICHGSFYVFCGTQQISQLVTEFKNLKMSTRVGAWDKTNPSPMNGTKLWLSGMEFCVFARKPKAIFNERCKKALWSNPSGRSKIHPTEKPVKLMERLILASSKIGDTILDCCMGSGTTGVACMNTNRKFIGIERDEKYFAICQQRIEAAANQTSLQPPKAELMLGNE